MNAIAMRMEESYDVRGDGRRWAMDGIMDVRTMSGEVSLISKKIGNFQKDLRNHRSDRDHQRLRIE